jgi:alanine dehydrogenase
MRNGVVKEIKPDEYRVALTPAGTRELVSRGHEVLVEQEAGAGSGYADELYTAAGAQISDCASVWEASELLLKVKEPIDVEHERLRAGQILFTYLHLAPAPELAEALRRSGATCIAYETVQTPDGKLPLLAPMSEVAGRLAPQAGAQAVLRPNGGRGVLLPGLPGVLPANVVVLGGGIVGYNAALIAAGMRANVLVLERSIDRMRELESMINGRARLAFSSTQAIEEAIVDADIVIGAVLVTGARAPSLVTRDHLSQMKTGAVLVDVAIDQGGCFETSKPTTHSHPTYMVDGVVHYCVANMPGAVPISSTRGLTNATLPYIELIAEQGLMNALRFSTALAYGLNVYEGEVTNRAVAESLGVEFVAAQELISGLAA